MCYVKCQNILTNVLVHLLEHLSCRLRCASFIWSKFTWQLKLIQSIKNSMVVVGIVGICATSSVLRFLLSGFWVSGLQVPVPKNPVPRSRVAGSHVPGSQFQGPGCQGSRVPGVRASGSRVSGPNFRLCRLTCIAKSNLINWKAAPAYCEHTFIHFHIP